MKHQIKTRQNINELIRALREAKEKGETIVIDRQPTPPPPTYVGQVEVKPSGCHCVIL